MIGRTYLAYTKASRPTGRVIARALGLREFGIKVPPVAPDILIRWGSRKPFPYAGIVVNDSAAIAAASDKVVALRKMAEQGLQVVPFFLTWEEVKTTTGRGHLVFGRSRSGFGGRDIKVYDPTGYFGEFPTTPTQQHDWYSLYVPARREVRIHVADGKVIRVQGKFNDNPEQNLIADRAMRIGEPMELIRNYKHGYRFRTPRQELHRHRKDAAIKAIEALGLDFGAVDMLLTGDRGTTILEVNTAPACSPLTAKCYAGAIAMMVHQKTGGRITLAPELLEVELSDELEDTENAESYIA